MATRKKSLPTKNHILAVSARLLLKQGYRSTTIREIAAEVGVSVSSVQNFFGSKEGILAELTRMMYAGQFGAARRAVESEFSPVYTYAVETAIQLALTERNENLREIYTAAYTMPETLEYIHRSTADVLLSVFGERFPDYDAEDFYRMEIGSAGLMRGYMACPCDEDFSLRKKVAFFLTASLRMYRVGEDEIARVLAFVGGLDLERAVDEVMDELFGLLQAVFDALSAESATA